VAVVDGPAGSFVREYPEGNPMSPVAAAPDADMDRQWRAWRARGVEGDRRRAAIMGRVITVTAIGFVIWLIALAV
jgi:hypothetical protein